MKAQCLAEIHPLACLAVQALSISKDTKIKHLTFHQFPYTAVIKEGTVTITCPLFLFQEQKAEAVSAMALENIIVTQVLDTETKTVMRIKSL